MRLEIMEGIKALLEGDAALTTALGGADQIEVGWPSTEITQDADNPVKLFWGHDAIGSGKSEGGNAAPIKVPDFEVPFHLFGIKPEKIATAVDALIDLLDEKLNFTTAAYKVMRIVLGSDITLPVEEKDWFHRIISMRFEKVYAT